MVGGGGRVPGGVGWGVGWEGGVTWSVEMEVRLSPSLVSLSPPPLLSPVSLSSVFLILCPSPTLSF